VGSAALFLSALELGCEGGILAVACFAAPLCTALWRAFKEGDLAGAATLERRLAPLQEIVGRYGPPGVKAAMDVAGLYGGPCRSPLASLPPAERDRVREWLNA